MKSAGSIGEAMIQFRELIKRMRDHGVECVVIGGVAGSLHGSPVATEDVDLCTTFDEVNLPRILAALRDLDPRIRDRPDRMKLPDDPQRLRGIKNLYLITALGKLDLLGELPGVCSYAELAGRTVEMDLGGFRCRVLDLDTLIAAKKAANRQKDQTALHHLEAIRKYRAARPTLFGA
jgi:hypothetical protein